MLAGGLRKRRTLLVGIAVVLAFLAAPLASAVYSLLSQWPLWPPARTTR
jgi:hypothetical protein